MLIIFQLSTLNFLLSTFDFNFLLFYMTVLFSQVPDSLVMVRPAAFGFNSDTAATNAFQYDDASIENLNELALVEFDEVVKMILAAGIDVHVLADTASPPKPDAIFPNNWFSMHADAKMILYP
jgi:hypothetical protein